MAIFIGSEFSYPSMNPTIHSPLMGKLVGQTGLFNLGKENFEIKPFVDRLCLVIPAQDTRVASTQPNQVMGLVNLVQLYIMVHRYVLDIL